MIGSKLLTSLIIVVVSYIVVYFKLLNFFVYESLKGKPSVFTAFILKM